MTTKRNTSKKDKDLKFTISGKIFWANVFEVNKKSKKYQLDLSLDEKSMELLESKGIETKEEGSEEGSRGNYVTLKSMYAPRMYDSKKNEITKKINIGNGSSVHVVTHLYNWNYDGDRGTSLGLDAVQIIDLVPFEDKTSSLFEEAEGYEEKLSDDDDAFEDKNPF